VWVSFLSCELLKGTYAHLTFTPRRGRHPQHTCDDTVEILDRLDVHTAGGLKEIADPLQVLEAKLPS
jgi:hypothetical protein